MAKRNLAPYPCKYIPSFGPVVLSMPEYLYFVLEVLFTEKMPCLSGFISDINVLNVNLMKR